MTWNRTKPLDASRKLAGLLYLAWLGTLAACAGTPQPARTQPAPQDSSHQGECGTALPDGFVLDDAMRFAYRGDGNSSIIAVDLDKHAAWKTTGALLPLAASAHHLVALTPGPVIAGTLVSRGPSGYRSVVLPEPTEHSDVWTSIAAPATFPCPTLLFHTTIHKQDNACVSRWSLATQEHACGTHSVSQPLASRETRVDLTTFAVIDGELIEAAKPPPAAAALAEKYVRWSAGLWDGRYAGITGPDKYGPVGPGAHTAPTMLVLHLFGPTGGEQSASLVPSVWPHFMLSSDGRSIAVIENGQTASSVFSLIDGAPLGALSIPAQPESFAFVGLWIVQDIGGTAVQANKLGGGTPWHLSLPDCSNRCPPDVP